MVYALACQIVGLGDAALALPQTSVPRLIALDEAELEKNRLIGLSAQLIDNS